MKLTLYHSVESTCSQKVRFVLSEKHLQWQEKNINLRKGEQFDPDYLKLNPQAVVPTLIHDAQVIRESTVIIEYLDDAFAEPALKPETPYERAMMRLFLKAFDEEVHPSVGILSYAIVLRQQMNSLFTEQEMAQHFKKIVDPMRRERQQKTHYDGLQSPAAAAAIVTLDKIAAMMEDALLKHSWLACGQFSLADATAAPYITRIQNLGLSAIWQDRPQLEKWLSRVTERVSHYGLKDPWGSDYFSELVSAHVASSHEEIQALLINKADI